MKIISEKVKLEDLIPLHPNEIVLIKKIRENYNYGKITIVIQRGVPVRIEKGIVSELLSQKDESEKNGI